MNHIVREIGRAILFTMLLSYVFLGATAATIPFVRSFTLAGFVSTVTLLVLWFSVFVFILRVLQKIGVMHE